MLALLCTASEQDHQPLAVLAEIDAVSRPEIKPQFKDSRTNPLCCGNIAAFQPVERNSNPRLYIVVQLSEPSIERIPSEPVDILANFSHVSMVVQKIPLRLCKYIGIQAELRTAEDLDRIWSNRMFKTARPQRDKIDVK